MSFRISQPSFQSLYVEMRANGNKIASGTAFAAVAEAGNAFLVTNRHNVTGRNQDTGEVLCKKTGAVPDSLLVWHNAQSALGQFVPVEVSLYTDDTPLWIEHPTLGASADLVALPLPNRSDIAIYPYRAVHFAHMNIEPAQTVSVVGFPFGKLTDPSFAVWATGFVASEPEINHGGRPVFLIDCRSRRGQSGSPVILHHGSHSLVAQTKTADVESELLGIYSGRINEESDLGVVWKAYAIVELLMYANTSRQPNTSRADTENEDLRK